MRIPRALVVVFFLLPACRSMPIAGPMAHMGAAHGMRAHHGRHAYQARGAYVPLHQSAYLTSALPEVAVQVLDRLAYCYMTEDSTIECGEY